MGSRKSGGGGGGGIKIEEGGRERGTDGCRICMRAQRGGACSRVFLDFLFFGGRFVGFWRKGRPEKEEGGMTKCPRVVQGREDEGSPFVLPLLCPPPPSPEEGESEKKIRKRAAERTRGFVPYPPNKRGGNGRRKNNFSSRLF